MPSPVMIAHRMYSGVTPGMRPGRISSVPRKSVNGTISAMPSPNTAFCTPNQPTMEMATTPPNSADPTLPKPAQRESRLVDSPSRAAAVPSAQLTTCKSTEPSMVARNASQNVRPKPNDAPSMSWETQQIAPILMKRTRQKGCFASSGTRDSE